MLATSWKATGLVRPAWQRLDEPKAKREKLGDLTGIPAPNLSGMNTGRIPMTPEMAERIVAAVPGLTLLDLGAPESVLSGGGDHSVLDRLQELEDALNELGPALREEIAALARRVRALEQQEPPKTAEGDQPQ